MQHRPRPDYEFLKKILRPKCFSLAKTTSRTSTLTIVFEISGGCTEFIVGCVGHDEGWSFWKLYGV
jgi:hypothetical protein